ncbi:MAG: type 4a pilus biogenesis protein PilO [Nevskiaceae bacterium]|jgi:type IV pilus assembly protein PilO|nr:type 4a pilus biogenesis protein PilO [Nevskiaceae bacterium]
MSFRSTLDELNQLDLREPGRWPLLARAGAIVLWFVFLSVVVIWLVVWNQNKGRLDTARATEQKLRTEFREKHAKAVNLDLYKTQLDDIERSFGAMLRQLPGKTEVPSLLVDISQTGLAAGLQQQLFQPQAQQNKDFYAELPIRIRLTGSYHEMGDFVSGIAALPRIVTLHDVSIKPVGGDAGFDQLQMDVTAKTYRYLDEDELAAAEAERRAAAAATRRAGAQ